jgi:hypothetical protein
MTLSVPPTHKPFLTSTGGAIRLSVVDDPVPVAASRDVVFESSGPWRVFNFEGGLLYQLRSAACLPLVYRGVLIDAALRRGTLFAPSGPRVPRYTIEHPLDELLFAHRLARDGQVLLHACGLCVGRSAVLFCGHSGAGKSTLARLWSSARPRARILSDDRVVVRRDSRGLLACGTPWHGEARFARKVSCSLGAVFFLSHADATRIAPLTFDESVRRLYACSFPPPWDAQGVAGALDCCWAIASRAACFDMAFRRDHTAVEHALRTIASLSSNLADHQ